ncbi:MAG: hypothetical protein V7K67_01805 [Nostoc sp.]|uniref:hypothetical protein n=1 Tax=Nostoc sp. TaxID=1180 RepID=UPI002FF90811
MKQSGIKRSQSLDVVIATLEDATRTLHFITYWHGKQKNCALDVGWVERSATQQISGCWVTPSLQRHLLQRS